jgi:hypothetical protein
MPNDLLPMINKAGTVSPNYGLQYTKAKVLINSKISIDMLFIIIDAKFVSIAVFAKIHLFQLIFNNVFIIKLIFCVLLIHNSNCKNYERCIKEHDFKQYTVLYFDHILWLTCISRNTLRFSKERNVD